jgi:hypothetical protein
MASLGDAIAQRQSVYLRMEELASGSSRDAHCNFPMVPHCHALLHCPFSIIGFGCCSFSLLYHGHF